MSKRILYSTTEYVQSHDGNILAFDNPSFSIYFSVEHNEAYCFKYSPIGAVLTGKDDDFSSFTRHENEMVKELIRADIKNIKIRLAPIYYPDQIPSEWLIKSGYQTVVKDINQYIELDTYSESGLHQMEQRKLQKAEEADFQLIREPINRLPKIHHFISNCRREAGLTINISYDKLNHQFASFPDHYSAFSVRKDNSIISAAIMVQPTPDICYYYLPATDPEYKQQSPMVFLLFKVIDYYKTRGIKIMDLGLSSIDGKKQQGLYHFKKRMGAQETVSALLEKNLMT